MKYIIFCTILLISSKCFSQFKTGERIITTTDLKKDTAIIQQVGKGWYTVLNKSGNIDTIHLIKTTNSSNSNALIAKPPVGHTDNMPINKPDSTVNYQLMIIDKDKSHTSL